MNQLKNKSEKIHTSHPQESLELVYFQRLQVQKQQLLTQERIIQKLKTEILSLKDKNNKEVQFKVKETQEYDRLRKEIRKLLQTKHDLLAQLKTQNNGTTESVI
jgi:hypothetical protein